MTCRCELDLSVDCSSVSPDSVPSPILVITMITMMTIMTVVMTMVMVMLLRVPRQRALIYIGEDDADVDYEKGRIMMIMMMRRIIMMIMS